MAPIDSLSIPNRNDKNTWLVKFKPAATAPQIVSANAIIAAFDPVAAQAAEDNARISVNNDAEVQEITRNFDEWSASDFESWFSANVNSAVEVKGFARVLGKLLLLQAK